MPTDSGFTRITRLPGQQQPAPRSSSMPTDQVKSFQNQQQPGLSTGTNQNGPASRTPAQQLLGMRRPETGVALSARRTTDAVRATNRRLMTLSQQQGAKRRAAEQQRQQSASLGVPGGYQSYQRPQYGQQGGGGGRVATGHAVSRIQGILKGFPGLRITETLGDRDYDRANGVARGPNSYHYDRNNPAVDIAGSTAELNRLYRTLVASGGWRQILWQVPGHYDHIHVA